MVIQAGLTKEVQAGDLTVQHILWELGHEVLVLKLKQLCTFAILTVIFLIFMDPGPPLDQTGSACTMNT